LVKEKFEEITEDVFKKEIIYTEKVNSKVDDIERMVEEITPVLKDKKIRDILGVGK